MLSATLEGEAEFIQSWRRCENEIRIGVQRGVWNGAKDGAAAARAGHTFKNRTGDLERSIQAVVVGWVNDHLYVANIRAGKVYASWVDAGTKPHLIVGNPFLVFVWHGVRVRFRYVNHPGGRPYPFMHLAYYKAERVIEKEYELAIARAQQELDK